MDNILTDDNLNSTDPTPEKLEKKKVPCSNCDAKIAAKAAFCPKCGQKQLTAKISMGSFLWKLWVTTFHVDNRLFSTLKYIFLPPKLTREYFAGRHKKYLHPLQFFFISLFFLFFIVSKVGKGKDSFGFFQAFGEHGSDYARGQIELKDEMRKNIDSLPQPWQTETTRKSVDSLLSMSSGSVSQIEKDSVAFGELLKDDEGKVYRLSSRDILNMEADSLLQYYKVNGWFDRLIARQYVKAITHEKELKNYWIGLISWTLLVLVVVMALWLKLLYLRRKRYFVEHFVLMLHLQIGFFMAFSLSILLRKGLHFGKSVGILAFVWFVLATYFAFKQYYGQGYGKTFLKWLIFMFLYFLSLIVVFLSSMGVAVLLF